MQFLLMAEHGLKLAQVHLTKKVMGLNIIGIQIIKKLDFLEDMASLLLKIGYGKTVVLGQILLLTIIIVVTLFLQKEVPN